MHELRALVEAHAPKEGRNESLHPGLVFYRFSAPQTCTKGALAGATLIVVVQGHKTVRLGGHVLDADPAHHLVVTRETELQSVTTPAGSDEPYLSLSLTFSPETIVKGLVALAEVGAEPPRETVPAFLWRGDAASEVLVRLLRALIDPVERQLIAPLIVEECALRLLRCDAASAMRGAIVGAADTMKVETAMRFMRSNAARPLDVQQVARHVGMSPSHFAHRFREVARVSPMRYLRQVRLGDARTLLLAGTRPSEAATRVGFESAAHFSREFKRFFGASPAEYVRRFRGA
jgi:AraC-like DNA-binding protein